MRTYAQFGTDEAILGCFPAGYAGSYLDVGCNDPVAGSNTYALYERGWTGMGVDPLGEALATGWAQRRPGDLFLGVGVADRPGEAAFWRCVESTVSSMDEREAALREAAGWGHERRVVRVVTVRGIVATFPRFRELDVLSVDVEGFERKVLQGCPWDEGWRPRVVVVEACRPCTETPSHADWEDILLGVDYRCTWQGGVNRLYRHGGS
jgi:FkbM family methyltransferase